MINIVRRIWVDLGNRNRLCLHRLFLLLLLGIKKKKFVFKESQIFVNFTNRCQIDILSYIFFINLDLINIE